MEYFSYGSNMCTGRLRRRVPSANRVCVAKLADHSFRFHKRSRDGSAKANAFFTGKGKDIVWGVVFEIDVADKSGLDEAEGLGQGYAERKITVIEENGQPHELFMYVAQQSHIDPGLRPYTWYTRFVLEGARQHGLPPEYIAGIQSMPAGEDPDRARDAANRQIACDGP